MPPDRTPTSGKVLVIDDEAPLRLLYRVNLEFEGLKVVEAVDGRSGLELARSEQPDIILLDVMIPKLDGWRVAEELRNDLRTRHIPFVFVTPRRHYRDRLRGLELGAADYITLPVNPLKLAPLVRELLERHAKGELEEVRQARIAEVKASIQHDPTGPSD